MHRRRPTESARTQGMALMVASAFGFSVMSLLVKRASAGLPAMEIVFVRSVVMTACTAVLLKRSGGSLRGHDVPTLVARGAIGATALSLLYWGLGRLPLGDATTLHYTAPVWTALAAAVVLHEPVRRSIVASVAVCLLGVGLVARPRVVFGGGEMALPHEAVAAVLASAVLSGLAYTLVRKLRATDAPLTIIFYLSWMGAVGALPFALTGSWRVPTPALWAVLLGVGMATLVGQFALTHALRRLEAGTATAVGYVQIVFAFGWGWALFGEAPRASALTGAALILGSVALLAAYLHRVPGTPDG